MNRIERAIPRHLKGIQKHFSAARKFVSVADARLCYEHALTRLLTINQWHDLSMMDKGGIQIMSGSLKPQKRKVKLGDYVRIGIPGPGNEAGSGFDWVQVNNLLFASGHSKEQCLLTLQPCAMPGGTHIAHFFDKQSTSNFLITRDDRLVTAAYYGKNELPNTDAGGLKDTLRNLTVATGAVMGYSAAMWEPLIKALLMDGTELRRQIARQSKDTEQTS